MPTTFRLQPAMIKKTWNYGSLQHSNDPLQYGNDAYSTCNDPLQPNNDMMCAFDDPVVAGNDIMHANIAPIPACHDQKTGNNGSL
jgi:hypothetical protein